MELNGELLNAFKMQGHFDVLRRDVLDVFQASEDGKSLEMSIRAVLERETESLRAYQSLGKLQPQDPIEKARLQSFLLAQIEQYALKDTLNLARSLVLKPLRTMILSDSLLDSEQWSRRIQKDIEQTRLIIENERLGTR